MKHCIFSRQAGGLRALAKIVLLGLLLVGAAPWLAQPLHAAVRSWTGSLDNNLWSNPNNWDPVGIPQANDDLGFYGGDVFHISSVNDLVDLAVSSVSFSEHDHELSGNPITITSTSASLYNGHDVVTGNPSYTTIINCPLIFPNGGEISTGGGPGQFL